MAGALDFSRFEVLTFDCYGTLVDWETGLLVGLRRVLAGAAAHSDDDALLEMYADAESELEAGSWIPYRDVLGGALDAVADRLGASPSSGQKAAFATSVGDWPVFPDAAAALAALRRRYRLGVITNCDDDLFAASDERLGRPFEWVITAEQARSYKPALRNFELAFERIGAPRGRILHVAQSLYHDHVPAKSIGLATAWINRRQGRPGSGATPSAEAVTPDLTVPDMATFAQVALGMARPSPNVKDT